MKPMTQIAAAPKAAVSGKTERGSTRGGMRAGSERLVLSQAREGGASVDADLSSGINRLATDWLSPDCNPTLKGSR